ncbi:MAG: hypothetical protein ACE5GM_11565 [bacterium]
MIGLILEIIFLAIAGLGNLRLRMIPFLVLYFLAFGVFLSAVKLSEKRFTVRFILLFALLFRVTMLLGPPSLSDDIHRYLWDGRVQNAGINPFRYPPDSPEVSFLRDEHYPGINHKEISTIYPPASQFLFRLVDRVDHSFTGMRAAFILVDFLVSFFIIKILGALGKDKRKIIYYAWNPLVIMEVASSGHVDVLGTALLLGAIWLYLRGWFRFSSFVLALSFLAKFWAVSILPFYKKKLKKSGWWVFPLTVLVLYLPFLDSPEQLFAGLFAYSRGWETNDSIFRVVKWLLGTHLYTRAVIVFIYLSLIWYLTSRYTGNILRETYILIGAFLLLSPTAFPWYFCWMVPFICFYEHPGWLYLTAVTPLSYTVLIDFQTRGIWRENQAVILVEYLPFLLISLRHFLKKRSS